MAELLSRTVEELEDTLSSTEFWEWLAFLDLREEKLKKDRASHESDLKRKARGNSKGQATMGARR